MLNFTLSLVNCRNLIFGLGLLSTPFLVFAQETSKYIKYIDSAEYNTQDNPKRSLQYLDSIPNPVEKYIEGHLAEYYDTKAILDNRLDNQAEIYQNLLLALKYAEI